MLDYIRIACAVPPVKLADVDRNTQDICQRMAEADEQGCDIVVFPELAMTGYTCQDLFFQDALLGGIKRGLQQIIDCSAQHPAVTAAVGLPVVIGGQMYNCGAVISGGKLQGLVPKTYLPNYSEFYERRWFSSSEDMPQKYVAAAELGLTGEDIPVGRDLLFSIGDGTLMGMEICEDLWTPMAPSTLLALNGAEVIVNLSASNETVGKRKSRQDLVKHQSSVCGCIYAYCSSGCTESTQDLVFSGHSMIAERGVILAENPKLIDTDYMMIQDADLGKIRVKRRQNKSVRDAVSFYSRVEPMRTVKCGCGNLRSDGSLYRLSQYPFIPAGSDDSRFLEIFGIQSAGLQQRLNLLGTKAVVGVSGGLDSALALLVCVDAMKKLSRPVSDVCGVVMPGFGTSQRTHKNALELIRALGVTCYEIDIQPAVLQHFRDIGHDSNTYDATYENAQARERTQVLMDLAGKVGGIVIGTGNLSESALGWCTYNADQMSMYSVNGSVPKTVVPHILQALANGTVCEQIREVILDILDTPISPELLPPAADGSICQKTEDIVGPYTLHDFFLYYVVRYGFEPGKIFTLACRAFAGVYEAEVIKKWLKVFYSRFFSQQYKRSCMPEGVKVGSVCLSPRGDWRMPSDASARMWLAQLDNL